MINRVDTVNRPPHRIRYGWPLHGLEWEELYALGWGAKEWQSRPLGHTLRRSIPEGSGVYMMCVRPPNATSLSEPFSRLMEVIYVGMSKNLRRRYGEHLNTPSPKVREARIAYSDSLIFWFLRVSEDLISTAESVLINCFGPPANDKPGKTLDLNVGPTVKLQRQQ